MKKKLCIKNLPRKVSADELNELLDSYGTLARFERMAESQNGSGRSGHV